MKIQTRSSMRNDILICKDDSAAEIPQIDSLQQLIHSLEHSLYDLLLAA